MPILAAMPAAATKRDPAADARAIVEAFLDASMIPDPVKARTYMSPSVQITFTGGRRFADPSESTAFNAARYKWVKKKFERTDVAPPDAAGDTVVYNIGTLYGEWPDGTAFQGNRYVDRFVLRDGKIVKMDVWNDSAEILLIRAGLAKP